MYRGVLILLTGILLKAGLIAQGIELSFESIGKERGLSSSNTTSITQDSLGYIWIGTQDGLNRFDGLEIKVFRHDKDDSTSLLHNFIRCLFTDSKGRVWIGTDDGLCYFQPEFENFRKISLSSQSEEQELWRVETVVEDDENDLLFSIGNEIFILDRTKMEGVHFVTVPMGEVTKIVPDGKDRLWIGTYKEGGLYLYNKAGNLIEHFLAEQAGTDWLNSNSIFDMALRKRELWIATEGGGINRLDIATKKFRQYMGENYYERFARFTYTDNQNRLWVGDYTGIKVYNDKEDRFYGYYTDPKDPASIRPNAFAIFQDSQDNYWVLYNPGGSGLSIQKKGFKIFSDFPNDTWHTMNRNISAIQEDYLGNLWLANPYNGIDIFHWIDQTTYRFTHEQNSQNTLGAGAIFAFCADGEDMWIGTNRGGLQLLNKGLNTFTTYRHDLQDTTTIAADDIRSVIVDHTGDIWVCVHGKGVDRFDKQEKKFYHYNTKNNKLSNDWTFQAIEDHFGNIWVATAYGLSRLPKGEKIFRNYYSSPENPGTISNNEIVTVFSDSLNRIWVGTVDGLNLYLSETDSFKQVKGMLEDAYICSLQDDNQNNIWASTLKGLYRYSPDTEEIRKFDEADGLPTNEFNPRASYKNLFNDMFFGSIQGAVLFNPHKIKYNSLKPVIIISGLKLFNKEITEYGADKILEKHISCADEINLEYDQNMITLEFSAISMIHPEKNSYAYMLEGFDEEWHHIGSKREATYTNLNPGKYTFRVIGANNDGVWNKEGTSIRIIVHPPWWMTWWFRILIIILALILITGIYLIRTNQLRLQKKHLEKQVKKSTAELQEKNKLLLEKSENLNETNTLLEERQQEILEQTTKLQELNTSKDRLFSIIAHDLTSPFNTILGFSELFFTSYDELDEEEKKEMAISIYDSSKSVYGLLDNLLNWARTQTDRVKYEPESLKIKEIVEDTIEVFKYRTERKKIRIDIFDNSLLMAYADKNMVMTILRNLISNAIKFTPQSGKIQVEINIKNEMLITSVTDNGVGIDKKVLKDLFDLSKSVSSEGTHGEKGSGIGLIITREFIRMNGGELSVKSEPGKGSTFSFSLPVNM